MIIAMISDRNINTNTGPSTGKIAAKMLNDGLVILVHRLAILISSLPVLPLFLWVSELGIFSVPQYLISFGGKTIGLLLFFLSLFPLIGVSDYFPPHPIPCSFPPFVTTFDTGIGKMFYINGEVNNQVITINNNGILFNMNCNLPLSLGNIIAVWLLNRLFLIESGLI